MKRATNPGHPKGKQAGIPKARYVCYSSDEDESHQVFQLNPTQREVRYHGYHRRHPCQSLH